jgi:predicted dehydrogenase
MQWDSLGMRPSRVIGDIEEILADPMIDTVVVAGDLSQRPAQLRRALQSERHVLCVYPPGDSPDITYEAAMIHSDTGLVLLPLLIGTLHPAIQRLREVLRRPSSGTLKLIQWDRGLSKKTKNHNLKSEISESAYFPGWEVLQSLGGPIAEVSAFAEQTARRPDDPLLVAGRFEKGGVFQAILSPHAADETWQLRLTASTLEAELSLYCSEKARLTWTDATETRSQEEWSDANPWREMARVFGEAVGRYNQKVASGQAGEIVRQPADEVTWQDAIRSAELDDAARRSVERRKACTLDYPEATEEVSFKGTMTLIGCGMLWVMLVLLVLSRWFPVLLVVIVIMLTVFLSLQVLRAIVKK